MATSDNVAGNGRSSGLPHTVPQDAGATCFILVSARRGDEVIPGAYNHVRPHQALDDKTPAQFLGINT